MGDEAGGAPGKKAYRERRAGFDNHHAGEAAAPVLGIED